MRSRLAICAFCALLPGLSFTQSQTLPVNVSAIFDLRSAGGHLRTERVIGAVGTDLWTTPTGLPGLSFGQTAWVGGQLNGGSGTGTGFGLFYTPPKGLLSGLQLSLSGGADAISGETGPGYYVSFSVMGTFKFNY